MANYNGFTTPQVNDSATLSAYLPAVKSQEAETQASKFAYLGGIKAYDAGAQPPQPSQDNRPTSGQIYPRYSQ